MPGMDPITKLSMVVLVGVLVGAIVLYHAWLDRRLARAREEQPARVRGPAGGVERGPEQAAR